MQQSNGSRLEADASSGMPPLPESMEDVEGFLRWVVAGTVNGRFEPGTARELTNSLYRLHGCIAKRQGLEKQARELRQKLDRIEKNRRGAS
jgi:hypothetical protein